MLSGEGHRVELEVFVREALAYYAEKGALSAAALPVDAGPSTQADADVTQLRYPGKVAVDAPANRLYVADTGHHRLLVATLDGEVLDVVGATGARGFVDGAFEEARFHAPNGLAVAPGKLYVADTENHAIRVVDLAARTVTTLVGTGRQGRDLVGGRAGREQPLSSPWDLVFEADPAGGPGGRLLVAMAGVHQIWAVDVATGRAERLAGSGHEANRNSADPKVTAFAQPSGAALGRDGALYIADSESSAIRAIGVGAKYYARAICGGNKADPSNLFAFGDVDGRGDRARLQHPLGVLFVPGDVWGGDAADGDVLVVADTYNHRLKVVRAPIEQGEVARWSGAGEPAAAPADGPADVARFAEPSGLALDAVGRRVLVADTNHHAIRAVAIPTGEVTTLHLRDGRAPSSAAAAAAPATAPVMRVRPPSLRHSLRSGHCVCSLASTECMAGGVAPACRAGRAAHAARGAADSAGGGRPRRAVHQAAAARARAHHAVGAQPARSCAGAADRAAPLAGARGRRPGRLGRGG